MYTVSSIPWKSYSDIATVKLAKIWNLHPSCLFPGETGKTKTAKTIRGKSN